MTEIEKILKIVLDILDRSPEIEKEERKWDSALSREIVKNHEYGPAELFKKTGAESRDLVLMRLRASKLNKIGWRKNYIRNSKEMINYILSGEKDLQTFNSKLKYFRKYNASDVTAKVFWVLLIEELKGNGFSEQVVTRSDILLKKVKRDTLYDLFFVLEHYFQTGQLTITSFDLESFFYKIDQFTYLLSSEYNREIPEGGRPILVEFIEEKNDLLKTVEDEIITIGASVRELVNIVQMEEKIKIFRTMNSADYGFLLDTLYTITLKILSKKTEEDSEVRRFLMLFRKFMIALKLTPIEQPGKELEIPVENLSLYNYLGSEVRSNETSKQVVVINPGWKLGKKTIIKTQVREVKN